MPVRATGVPGSARALRAITAFTIAVFLSMLSGGCGYTVLTKANLPFDTVKIGNIKNTTSEPKLQDKLYEALTVAFMKRGVSVTDSSDNVVEGTINYFGVGIAATSQNVASSYVTVIKGDFTFKGPDGKVRRLPGMSSPFYESFDSQLAVNDIISAKESEDEQAIGSLALRLVSELLYRDTGGGTGGTAGGTGVDTGGTGGSSGGANR